MTDQDDYQQTLKAHLEEIRTENARLREDNNRLRDENSRVNSENRRLRDMLDENGFGVLFNFAVKKTAEFFKKD